MNERIKQLDSLRGLAAITVVLCHFTNVFPLFYEEGSSIFRELKSTPLSIFVAGHEAVIFFFILSGFVLSLPFYSCKNTGYFEFLTKRIFRVYIPYICAVFTGIFLSIFLYNKPIEEFSSWFNSVWSMPLTIGLIVDHILLIGSFKNGSINPVLWSLVHEMRISIIFPFLVMLIKKYDYKLVLFIGWVLSCVGGILYKYVEYQTDYLITFHYMFFFIIGALIAKHRLFLIRGYQNIYSIGKLSLVILAAFLYS